MAKSLCILMVIGTIGCVCAVAPGGSFEVLTGYPIGEDCEVVDVSGNGDVVVGSYGGFRATEACMWIGTEYHRLEAYHPSKPYYSDATAVSDDGSTIVGWCPGLNDLKMPIRWDAPEWTPGQLGQMTTNSDYGWASDVSWDGSVVVGTMEQPIYRIDVGFAVFPGMGFYQHRNLSSATCVSANGEYLLGTIAGSYRPTVEICRGDYVQTLGTLAGYSISSGRGMTDWYGTIIGVCANSGSSSEAWRSVYPHGSLESLGFLPGGTSSETFGLSGCGTLIVGRDYVDGHDEPFIWDPFIGMRNLRDHIETFYGADTSDFTDMTATSISAEGLTVVGYGTTVAGATAPWRVRLGTEWQVPVGSWAVGANWQHGVAPTSSTIAVIDEDRTVQVTEGPASAWHLIVGASQPGSSTVSHTGGTVSVTGNTYVGQLGTGTYNQSGGVHSAGGLLIGKQPGSIGLYSLSGNARLEADSIRVGGPSADVLFVEADEFEWLSETAEVSTTEMTIEPGGILSLGFDFSTSALLGGEYFDDVEPVPGKLSLHNGSLGVVNGADWMQAVDILSLHSLFLADGATCTMTGGHVSGHSAYVGISGSAEVDQSGGIWEFESDMYLGINPEAEGRFLVSEATSTVSLGTLRIGFLGNGFFSQNEGSVSVSNEVFIGGVADGAIGEYNLAGGQLSASSVTVGLQGEGAFTWADPAATIDIAGKMTVGDNGAGVFVVGFDCNLINLLAGDLFVNGTLDVGQQGTVHFQGQNPSQIDSRLYLHEGCIRSERGFLFGASAELLLLQPTEMAIRLTGHLDGGAFAVASTDPSKMTGLADLTLRCEFDVNGVAPVPPDPTDNYNRVTVEMLTDTSRFDGGRVVPTADDFDADHFVLGSLIAGQDEPDPANPTSRQVLVTLVDDVDNYPGENGASVDMLLVKHLHIRAGGGFDVGGTPVDGKIFDEFQLYYLRANDEEDDDLRQLFPGDLDFNGQVDLEDFVILKQNFTATNGTWMLGDFDGDRDVDLDDFVTLKQFYARNSDHVAPPAGAAPMMMVAAAAATIPPISDLDGDGDIDMDDFDILVAQTQGQ